EDLWVWSTAEGTLSQVTHHAGPSVVGGVWADGKHLIYATAGTDVKGLFSIAANGSSQPVALGEDLVIPQDVWRDVVIGIGIGESGRGRGRGPGDAPTGPQFWTLKLGPDATSAAAKRENFQDSRFVRSDPAFSPDGRWVAFASDQNGRSDIFVVSFPKPDT